MHWSLADSSWSHRGEWGNGYAGWSLSAGGDVNGDGFDDLVVGAPHATNPTQSGNEYGEAYLVLGGSGGWSMDLSLGSVDASFLGDDPQDWAGASVAIVDDVNGDGLDDVVVGVPGDSAPQPNAGGAFLFFGRASGWSLQTPLSSADASFVGERTRDGAGIDVSGAGDFDGDGYGDLLIGALREVHASTPSCGRVHVVFGHGSGWALGESLSTAAVVYEGEAEEDAAGASFESRALAGVGDLDGDLLDDFVVGAPWNDEAFDDAGQVYVVHGHSGPWQATDVSLSTADASFHGERQDALAGFSVGGAGDVDGDGYDDLLIGAPGDSENGSEAGQVYLVLGLAAGWAMDNSLAAADASFHGQAAGEYAGYAVAGAGDADGDGYDDLLIGAPRSTFDEVWQGEAYLVMGRVGGWSPDLDLAQADGSFLGELASAQAGHAVASGGDLDGDGWDDLVLGAPYDDDAVTQAGQVYTIRGGPLCVDADGDGYGAPGVHTCLHGSEDDCDDGSADVNPGADEICNGFDDDCDGIADGSQAVDAPTWYFDSDGDGHGNPNVPFVHCDQFAGFVADGDDCDDANAASYPGAPELCDGEDNDCDGVVDADEADADGDGWGICAGDCDDSEPAAYPGAAEVACDYVDNDCDDALHAEEVDDDGDGADECGGDCNDSDGDMNTRDEDGDGWSTCAGDCDDEDPSLNLSDEDGDGFDTCEGDCDDLDPSLHGDDGDGDGYSPCTGDCDDGDDSSYPGNLEICDGADNDCNGAADDVDADGDGQRPEACGGEDCDDGDADVHSDAAEACDDSVDNDCDGDVDGADPDCADGDDDTAMPDDDVAADDDTDELSLASGCQCRSAAASTPSAAGLAGVLSLLVLRRRDRRRA